MTYGLDRGLFVEDGPAHMAASIGSDRKSVRFRAWRKLNAESRLKVVERALAAPANDLIDNFPIAL